MNDKLRNILRAVKVLSADGSEPLDGYWIRKQVGIVAGALLVIFAAILFTL